MLKSSQWHLLAVAFVALALSAQGCGLQEAPGEAQEWRSAPIVGGEPESGWPAVGALAVLMPGYGYGGAFCSATLVAPQWIMTAGHCLAGDSEFPLAPHIVYFSIGPDARPDQTRTGPTDGRLYAVDGFFIHPQYAPALALNDIALAHLAEPVTDVEPIPYRDVPLGQDAVGKRALYVGYGVDDGRQRTGVGVKRSAEVLIDGVYTFYYVSATAGSGVCFGDSGGPGLLEGEAGWEVIGVNSFVRDGVGDPCLGASVHVKPDYYVPWIERTMATNGPSCDDDPSACLCPAACLEGGGCDDEICRVLSCRAVVTCGRECPEGDGLCVLDCYGQADEQGSERLGALNACMARHCANEEGGAATFCRQQYCQSEETACLAPGSGPEACRAVVPCALACPSEDDECRLRCREEATEAAQPALATLVECARVACDAATLQDPVAGTTCAARECPTEFDACWLPAQCDLRGGDCGEGEACGATLTGATDCLPAGVASEGDSCDPEARPQDCADGLVCGTDDLGSFCAPACITNEDCLGGVVCQELGDQADVGVCLCRDEDGDGACRPDDCDDDRADLSPLLPELCDDIDNNCDGQTDEGCGGGGCSQGPWDASRAPLWWLIVPIGGLLLARRFAWRFARRGTPRR